MFEDICRRIFFTEEIEIKDGLAIMLFKLKSVFVSTGRDSDKPERININLVARSLVDEAEGEIWPNPVCIT